MSVDHNPLQWLWAEIGRRFGPDQAADLLAQFEQQRRALMMSDRLEQCREQLPQLEQRLRELEESGEPDTAYTRSLRWRIDYQRRLLQEVYEQPLA